MSNFENLTSSVASIDGLSLTADFETKLGHNSYDVTVMAIRGTLVPFAAATPPTDVPGEGAAGICWVPEDTAVTDFPDPLEDDYDWIWHSFFALGGYGIAPTNNVALAPPAEINNRSMRKQREGGSKLVIAVHSDVNQNVDWAGGVRVLYAMP